MMYKIEVNKRSYKFILKQDKEQQTRILNAINKLPDNGDIKPLKGCNGVYRLRVGDYRILYTIDHDVLTVYVIEIGNRGQIYK